MSQTKFDPHTEQLKAKDEMIAYYKEKIEYLEMDSDDLVEAQLIACKQMDAKQFNIIPDAEYDYNNGKYQELLQWLKREGASGNCK